MHLAGIFVYPVKSLRGVAVEAATVDSLGLADDRRLMVVDPTGKFMTQRTWPRMALIETALEPGTLRLAADGAGEVRVPLAADPAAALRSVAVWKSENLQAEDAGEAAARWLGDFLEAPCRLVRIGAAFTRPIPARKLPGGIAGAGAPPRLVSFADDAPFLALTEASLADLNGRVRGEGGTDLPMDRFRPNLVIGGALPYAEDGWDRFRIGEVVFRGGEPCARCIITATDQATAVRGTEPLRTLAGYRRDAQKPSDVNFGRNLIHETLTGTLRAGDAVEVL